MLSQIHTQEYKWCRRRNQATILECSVFVAESVWHENRHDRFCHLKTVNKDNQPLEPIRRGPHLELVSAGILHL